MSKPLHKDVSFWIVAATLVVAADVAQWKFGVPWFKDRLASMKPAPRAALTTQGPIGFAQQTRNPPHAPGEWRLPYFEQNIFQSASNVVALLPTKFETPSGGWTPDNPPVGGWGTKSLDKAIGIRMQAEYVIQTAYDWNSRSRMLFQDRPPSGQFDFIANLPSGAFEALRQEIKDQWGIVGERQSFQTNALVLVVSRAGVLQPRTPGTPMQSQPNTFNFGSLQNMVSIFESILSRPILNETHLTGIYDIRVPSELVNGPRMMGGSTTDDRMAGIKKYLDERFGLGLVETNTAVEMLVVRKVGEPVQLESKGKSL